VGGKANSGKDSERQCFHEWTSGGILGRDGLSAKSKVEGLMSARQHQRRKAIGVAPLARLDSAFQSW
jgi:hypothetical protein